MPQLTVQLFGQFDVSLQGEPIHFSSDKLKGLFAYLLLTSGTPHSRDALASFLWGEFTPNKSRTNLRLSLSRLRKSLAPFLVRLPMDQPFLTVDRKQVQLHRLPSERCEIDAWKLDDAWVASEQHPHDDLLRCSRCMGSLRGVMDQYQGTFLEDLSIPESEDFAEWSTQQREFYHTRAMELASRITQYAQKLGDWDAVRHHSEQQLSLEPWCERAHRHLMQYFAERGDLASVQDQYDQCCGLLETHTGLPPEAETTALFRHLHPGTSDAKASDHAHRPQASFAQHWPDSQELEQSAIQLRGLLLDPVYRLVTVLGHDDDSHDDLARLTATTLQQQFTDGVVALSMAEPSRESNPVGAYTRAVAEALDWDLYDNEPPLQQLLECLEGQEILLLLEQFMPTPETIDWLVTLLEDAPTVTFLLTSSQRLHLHQEVAVQAPSPGNLRH